MWKNARQFVLALCVALASGCGSIPSEGNEWIAEHSIHEVDTLVTKYFDAVPAEARLYDHLFNRPDPGADGDFLDDLSPDSLEVIDDAWLEPSIAAFGPGDRFQLERLGYFCVDPDSTPARPVLNRTVTLRDTWAKVKARG